MIDIATHALDILDPIENWPCVARAYAPRAKAHKRLGNEEQAAKDRQELKEYKSKIDPQDNHNG